MNSKQSKYIFNSIIAVAVSAVLIILTLKYGLKSSPIMKVLALLLLSLSIFYTYLTITNKPKNNDGE
ncbi:MAG: hypothetical protein ACI8Q1_001412 [Parvicella sp.]|jgi:hypothetical protein